MAYIVSFRGQIVAGPFPIEGMAINAAVKKAKELNNTYPVSEFKVQKV
ncbi:MAG: hypothetical protein IKP35_00785 [Alphaproteobacteria bacterium]|nr:hypothetical protein [Alphaproteobacteria bacterium]MBR0212022.1 hypothetical protein [Alphaproteobacteria bacterium]MBR4624270.1 hypothetical protein [Alphaproteobacteria bacterium]MBR6009941.1 hypothetical protein [Alphaproteobacteria bacterium]